MAYKPRFAIWAVGGGIVSEKRLSMARDALFHLCMALAKVDYDYLSEFPDTPLLYSSGLKYFDDTHQECWQNVCKIQEDDWADVFHCRQNGYLDCEDAVAWRCAELWRRGINALPFPVLESEEDGQMWHMLVVWPNGHIEDPSAILGMRTAKNYDADNARLPRVLEFVRAARPMNVLRAIQHMRRAA